MGRVFVSTLLLLGEINDLEETLIKFDLADVHELNIPKSVAWNSFIAGYKLLRVHYKIHKCLDLLGESQERKGRRRITSG